MSKEEGGHQIWTMTDKGEDGTGGGVKNHFVGRPLSMTDPEEVQRSPCRIFI